jgi:hypothetical protein
MAINNDAIYNAAFIGALAGMVQGRGVKSATATDYATEVNAAEAYALKVDSLIAEDATIATGGGDASYLAGSTSTIVYNGRTKGLLMKALSQSAWVERASVSTTQSDYATIAAAVVALYTEALTKLTNAA